MIDKLDAEALAGLREVLTPDAVQQAPEAIRPMLARVRAALQESEPGQANARLDAIAAELADTPGLRELLASWLGRTATDLADTLDDTEQAAQAVEGRAAEVARAQETLRTRLDELPDGQAEQVRQALDALDAAGLTEDLTGLLGRVQLLGGDLAGALAGGLAEAVRSGDADAAAHARAALGPIEGLLQGLGDDTEDLTARLEQLRQVADALQQVAADQVDSAEPSVERARLLLERARAAERQAAQRGEAGPEDLWWAAFTVGEAAQDLETVWDAGARLIAGASDAGDAEAILDLARRRGAVARAVGHEHAAVVASIEEGRALSNLERHDAAESLLLKAVSAANRTGERRLIARARLAAAGALQLAGQNLEAEQELIRLLGFLDEDMEGLEDVVARTAMGLAMALNDQPDKAERRTQALHLAARFGDRLADPRIYVPSKVGLVFAADEAGDHALAVRHLVEGRLRAQDLGEGPARAFTDALLVLQESWGEQALADALKAHREGSSS